MPRVLITIPYESDEWEGLDVGDTFEAKVLLQKQEDGSGLVTEMDGTPIPLDDKEVMGEEMAVDEEEDFNEALGEEMA
jgi:hypothetical protein